MRRLTILALGIAALVLSACGTQTIDSGKLQKNITTTLNAQLQSRGSSAAVSSVSCPGGQKSKTGNTFTCTAKFSDGTQANIDASVVNGSHGDVSWRVAGK